MTTEQSTAQASAAGATRPDQGPQAHTLTTELIEGKPSDRGFQLAMTNYGHIEQQAALSATKSALLVAAHALLGAVYVGLIKEYRIFSDFAWSIEACCYAAAGVALGVGFILSLWAISPKSKSDQKGDVLFFASIDTFSNADEFVSAYRGKDEDALYDQLLRNIYGKSCWLSKKFWLIRGAIYCSAVGTILAIGAMVWLAPRIAT